MTAARYIIADVRDGLAQLADEGIAPDVVLTSPPFLALRSYLAPDHPDKHREIGGEPDPAAFLTTMIGVVEGCAAILAPHGSIVFEFGDTYSGSGGAGGDYADDGIRSGQETFDGSGRSRGAGEWPLPKSLCMIPELFASSLAYGRNLLDPERITDPWRIRNTIAWVRTNPPVGALGDKFRPAKSLLTVATKASDRWFDLDAVRTAHTEPVRTFTEGGHKEHEQPHRRGAQIQQNPAGAPPLDWWIVNGSGYAGSHYAAWPPELLHKPIQAMCPRRVCRACGTPSRRIVVTTPSPYDGRHHEHQGPIANGSRHTAERDATTTGWTTCGCAGTEPNRLDGFHTDTGWRPGLVLDPFGGSGTTGVVATGLGRDAILIDIDARNADLARERLGMFVTIDA